MNEWIGKGGMLLKSSYMYIIFLKIPLGTNECRKQYDRFWGLCDHQNNGTVSVYAMKF
jgi:hypothetical protein